MIVRKNVVELDNLFADEIARVHALAKAHIGDRHNNAGQIKKCELVRRLLCSLPEETVLAIESCRGDNEIREFALANAGSVVECIIKALLDKARNAEYTKAWKDDDADAINGCIAWEIKFSGDAHYKATPAKGDRATLLVNCDGVSLIKKAEVLTITDKKGRLPAKGLYGNRNNLMIKWLMDSLLYETADDE